MKRQSYFLVILMLLSGVAFAQNPDAINSIQQTQIKQLVQKIDSLQKQLTCVTQNAGSASTISCRTATQDGRNAACNAGETLTGGGVRNAWGVAVLDSMPSGQGWFTSSSDWNTMVPTAKGTTTYAVCCRIVPTSIANLCPASP